MTISGEDLLAAFEEGRIDTPRFGHREHLRVAYLMLRKHDFLDATCRYARMIEKLAKAAGAPKKFNVTITVAFMSLIAERMAESVSDDDTGFLAANPDLLEKQVLASLYSRERLASDLARSAFLLPDEAA